MTWQSMVPLPALNDRMDARAFARRRASARRRVKSAHDELKKSMLLM
jgi:hypothetical protein